MEQERPRGPQPISPGQTGPTAGGEQARGIGGGGGQGQFQGPRLEQYYSNVAVIAVSPREISVLFGRYVPAPQAQQQGGLMPIYEKQILMTVEQAHDLVRTLGQAVEEFKTRGQGGQTSQT